MSGYTGTVKMSREISSINAISSKKTRKESWLSYEQRHKDMLIAEDQVRPQSYPSCGGKKQRTVLTPQFLNYYTRHNL